MESIAHESESEKGPLTVDRIIAVFAYLPTSTLSYRKNSNLHISFKQLADEYPEQFENVRFGPAGSFTHSEELDDAIEILQISGLATEFIGGRQGEIELFHQAELREMLSRFEGVEIYEDIAVRFRELVETA